ncbi:H(+)/Cl(-) exchange transporter ClcA [Clostridium akagii]|uniref:H(+)/Cl(-) exchange transporter ClcA n=1 Tax=Clostridium akagii TaxID=91623 RepID=UPI000562B6C3|nr:H(+)/Cl(-) exchange transporter ClcA [Clostridium akagii]
MDKNNTRNKNSTNNILINWHDFKLKIIIEGMIVGFFTGLLIVFYRYLLNIALTFTKHMYSLQLKNHWLIPVWFVVLIAGGWIVGTISKKNPMVSGSGIPQVEGVLSRKLSMSWWRVVLFKFVGGVISIGAGLSLGREGPSVQMGAAVGQGFSRIFKRLKIEENFLITSGASAGLSAAFNAPFAGVIFALEEMHKNFSPTIMTSALAASLTADFVSKEFFSMKPMFDFKQIIAIPLNNYAYIIVLGIILGLLGVVFNKAIFKSQDIYGKLKNIPAEFKPIIAFLVAGVLGIFMPEVLGGGENIISFLVTTPLSLKVLLLILIVKFLFTMISYGSSAPGGIFLPLLVVGALIGVIYGNVMHDIFGFNLIYIPNLVILGMAGYFAAIVKAPITGCILITEMTGSFSHLLSVGLVCLIAYMVVDVLNSKPIYEVLLERFLLKGTNKFKGKKDTKVIMETSIFMGSKLDGKMVKEMKWPTGCLVVAIKRGEMEIIPTGTTKIMAGDYLVVLSNEDNASLIKESLSRAGEFVQ